MKSNSSKTDFLTHRTKEAFSYLWKAFIEAWILYHFDIKQNIRIETDDLGVI